MLGNRFATSFHTSRKVYEDMTDESSERLAGLLNEMKQITNREFWEVSERGTNFTYISDEQKAQVRNFKISLTQKQLPLFFSWFTNLSTDSKEEKVTNKNKKHQDL